MAKFDFFNKSYNLKEIIDGYMNGSLDNFKGDEEFLDFLISYTLGDNLEGPDADNYKEYAKYNGLLSIALLDQYDMLGETLYKIYEICNKDKMNFIRVCHHIGEYTIRHTFNRETIEVNLKLSHPVEFVDDSIVLADGTKPVYDYDNGIIDPYHMLKNVKKADEYEWELERSLRHRINESIKANGDDIELLEEMVSFAENEKIKKETEEAKLVKDDYEISINNLYFGKQTLDVSGGILGINMECISWFEDTNVGILNYKILRSVPDGDYCMVDSQGNIHIPEEVVSKGNAKIGPNSPIRKVQIASVSNLFESEIEKLEEDPINNEEDLYNLKGVYELLQQRGSIAVGELNKYYSVIRAMYESCFGEMFKTDSNQDGYYGDVSKK